MTRHRLPQAFLSQVERYRHLWAQEHFLGPIGQTQRQTAHDQLQQDILKTLQPLKKGREIPVERRKDLSDEEFLKVYYRRGIPVIFQGKARHWRCVQDWSPTWLAETYGEDPVALIDAAPQNVEAIDYGVQYTTLAALVSEMDQDPLTKYSRFNRLLYDHPELYAHFDVGWLKGLRKPLSSGQTFQVFIGGKNSRTHLHAAAEPNLFTQVYGQKHWVLYPPEYDALLRPPVKRNPYFHSTFNPDAPDLTAYPAMAYVDYYTCLLEPGDVLFNPASWWHHINNPTGSIGVGFRWFPAGHVWKMDWTQTLLTLCATEPPLWRVMPNRDNFAKIFGYMKKDAR